MSMRTFISLLMAFLIAIQSIVVMADVHQFHQTGNSHKELSKLDKRTGAKHQSDVVGPLFDNSAGAVKDCPHCCHCHGQISLALVFTVSYFASLQTTVEQADHQAQFKSNFGPSLFRPPII